MSLLLDTNALIWLLKDSDRLGRRAGLEIDDALQLSRVLISAAPGWEVAGLVAKNRVRLDKAIEEVPLDGEVAIESVALDDLHWDPVDRFIVATAVKMRATLVTSDDRLLSWKGPLACIDARV